MVLFFKKERLATSLYCALAMVAFAANSLLARSALAAGAIDPASFTAIRLASGAVALTAILIAVRGRGGARAAPGNWPSAVALLAYALAFSFAYLRLGAATGALILFAAVQGTMILAGVLRQDHPRLQEVWGLTVAFAAFVYLLLPGLGTPDPLGSALMTGSGIAWGVYSLRGRGARDPLGETAGNFVRSAVICVPCAAVLGPVAHATSSGVSQAVVSGVVTSGFGYAVWYRALPGLSRSQAATVQLTVPVIAALGAVIFLSEAPTLRLVIASTCLLAGVALAILSKAP